MHLGGLRLPSICYPHKFVRTPIPVIPIHPFTLFRFVSLRSFGLLGPSGSDAKPATSEPTPTIHNPECSRSADCNITLATFAPTFAPLSPTYL
jgi:hypothetical protein